MQINRLREILKCARRLGAVPRYLQDLLEGRLNIPQVVYVVEDANWSIRWDGIHIIAGIAHHGCQGQVDTHPSWYANRILHFGSLNTFSNHGLAALGGRNKVVVTVFHGDFGMGEILDRSLRLVLDHYHRIDRIVVAASVMEERFKTWGIPAEKVCRIPLGVDLAHFYPLDAAAKEEQRKALGILPGKLVIGSFQKDGNGWGEGLIPKLIKGPDIFVDVVSVLAAEYPVQVLLSGPARGFVQRRLDELGIPWTHRLLDDPRDVASLYQACDLYLVTSREEGGPKAILEAMATGVPLVTTSVGMAPDVVEDRLTGRVVPVGDTGALVDAARDVLEGGKARCMRDAALRTAQKYGWDAIAAKYAALYKELS